MEGYYTKTDENGEVMYSHRKPWCRERIVTKLEGDSMVQKSALEECDINKVIEKFNRTGILPRTKSVGQFADVTGVQGDLTEKLAESEATLSQFANDVKAAERAKAAASQADGEEKASEPAQSEPDA